MMLHRNNFSVTFPTKQHKDNLVLQSVKKIQNISRKRRLQLLLPWLVSSWPDVNDKEFRVRLSFSCLRIEVIISLAQIDVCFSFGHFVDHDAAALLYWSSISLTLMLHFFYEVYSSDSCKNFCKFSFCEILLCSVHWHWRHVPLYSSDQTCFSSFLKLHR